MKSNYYEPTPEQTTSLTRFGQQTGRLGLLLFLAGGLQTSLAIHFSIREWALGESCGLLAFTILTMVTGYLLMVQAERCCRLSEDFSPKASQGCTLSNLFGTLDRGRRAFKVCAWLAAIAAFGLAATVALVGWEDSLLQVLGEFLTNVR